MSFFVWNMKKRLEFCHFFKQNNIDFFFLRVYNTMVRKNRKKVTFLNTLLTVSVALLAGLLMTRIFKRFKLPAVTAYLIAGVLIGPFALGAIGIDGLGFSSEEAVSKLAHVSQFYSSEPPRRQNSVKEFLEFARIGKEERTDKKAYHRH